jgi:acyl carrier protein phosphodiesterase
MNYLAHVFLSHQTPDAVVGALLGDFVKGRVPAQWSPAVRAAVLLHRAIDRYTDHHPIVIASRALVNPDHRRFAGIAVDVFYDHFLAHHWQRFDTRPLPEFTASIYRALSPQAAAFPERLQQILPRMVKDDWLAAYADVSAIGAALRGITRRFRTPQRAHGLHATVVDLERHYAAFENHFLTFFPQLQQFVTVQDDAGNGVVGY